MLICLGYKGLHCVPNSASLAPAFLPCTRAHVQIQGFLSSLCSGSFAVTLFLETCFIEHPWKFLPLVRNLFSHFLLSTNIWIYSFPGGSVSKESACNARDPASVPESGKSPGEGNATHFSVLAWEISWIEEPGGLQSMELQRVGHDLATKPLLPFEHRILHKNLVGSQSAHGFFAWRTKSFLIPSVHQQWEAGSGVGWCSRDEKQNAVFLGPAALLNPRGLLLMRVTVIKLKTCQDPFFLCSLKKCFLSFQMPFFELEKVLIKETSPPV